MINNKDILIDSFHELGISIDERRTDCFLKYYDLLMDWNLRMNLTSITDYGDVVTKHFVDSVSLLKYCYISENSSLVDIGTGAGFPGIPIKIVRPDLSITLVDSLNKRVTFLQEVINCLDLKGITAVHGRAEELGTCPQYREQFDLAVSRAVADLSVLCEYTLPFVKPDGLFVSYKSGKIEEEKDSALNALSLLSGHIDKVEMFRLPFSDIDRSLVVVRKDGKTDSRYPRKSAQIKKKPL